MNWFGKVDQARNRFFILTISFLVLVVALAGLMGILDTLPQPIGAESSPGGKSSSGGSPGGKAPPGDLLQESVAEESTIVISSDLSCKSFPPPHIPILEVTGAATTSYLKSKTASIYDGERWQIEDNTEHYRYEGEILIPPVTSYNQKTEDDIAVTSIFTPPTGTVPLLTSLYPLRVIADVPLLYFPEEQVFHSEEGFLDDYTFRTAHYAYDDSILLESEVDPQGKYLQLPAGITQRIRELARTITKGDKTPYQKAKTIENYLKTNYTYDPYFEHAPEGWEPNDWFLFENERGVCGNFNSAFVVLSRSVGIPARLSAGFLITPQPEKQVVYTDQAHAWAEVKFKELGWYIFDATGSYSPLATTTEITSIDPIIKKGHSFMVQGTVQAENGNPADGQWVEIFINPQKETQGGLLIGEGETSSDGGFNIEAAIPSEMDVGDYHILAHCLESGRYMESWSDPLINVVTDTNLNMQVPSRIKVQEPVTLQGTLTEEFGKPLVGQRIAVYLADIKVTELTTSENGQFVWGQGFDKAGAYTLKVDFAGIDYYLESSREAEFQVLTPTTIKLDAMSMGSEAEATVDEPVLISGYLFEEMTDKSLSGQKILIFVNGEPVEGTITTDEKGMFKIEHTFDDAGQYQIEARFSSVPFYWESSARTDLEVFPAPGVSLWSYLIIMLTLVLTGTGGFFIYRRQKQRQLLAVPATSDSSAIEAIPLLQREVSGHTVSLAIEFPGIKSPFPDVWGLDEDLEIVCHLTGPQGDGLAGKPLEAYISSDLVVRLTTDKGGTGKFDYTFTGKGQYEIIVRAKEEPGVKDVSAQRKVHIVDYREEIVSLFEALVSWFRNLGIDLNVKLTPCEIAYRVLNTGKDISEKDVDQAVSCFEEADYSLHSIDRSHYQAMYLAQREIREHGGESTREP
ncbi:transglutaminase domain-containing protein [Chloroflexota bacterium]